jgi:hypothetical protein
VHSSGLDQQVNIAPDLKIKFSDGCLRNAHFEVDATIRKIFLPQNLHLENKKTSAVPTTLITSVARLTINIKGLSADQITD